MTQGILKIVHIDSSFCYCCGEFFNKDTLAKTKHHAIPQCVSPAFNLTLPICKQCHKKLNDLYVNQEKRKKAPRPLKYYANKFEGLKGSMKRLDVKLDKVYTEMQNEIKNIEEIEKDNHKEETPKTS